ncbi:MAG: PadR family transcriptional regulator [Woeseiaceae bacterium]
MTYLEVRGIVKSYVKQESMRLMGQSNPPFMSGVPELLLLRLLAQREMYGYELVKSVKLVTLEAISLGEGVIYPVLHGLERNGALKAKRKAVGGRTRVYYSLTAKGKQRLRRLEDDWQRIQGGVNAALGEASHA